MLPAMARHAPSDTSLRDKVYEEIVPDLALAVADQMVELLREALTAVEAPAGQMTRLGLA
mgnify:CR=1 FL=1